jgi:hypothetical protein
MNTRDLKFDLNVESNALFQPNPTEFYTKAYISEDIAGNFRVIPNVKNATKVSNVLFGDLLQPFNCSFTNETADLGAVDVPVCSLAALAQICQADLESSWLSAQMTQGSNGDTGSVITIYTIWDEVPDGLTAAANSATTLTVRPPAVTHIANTWGAITLSGTVSGT